jgi:hypothetical protein
MISTKEYMTKIIEEQPDDSSYEEILRELAFARMISDDEMKKRIKSWQT